MKNSTYVRAALAQAGLEFLPPLIRKTLLDESGFLEEYGFKVEAIISFGDSGFSVQSSDLFDAVRKIFSGASRSEVTDTNGQEWIIEDTSDVGDLPKLELSCAKQRLILPNFAVLSPDSTTRLRALDEAASDVNLPCSVRDAWRNILAERALGNDEVDAYYDELRDTPIEKARAVRSEIKSGQGSISTLVPSSRRYFERLVGAYDGSVSIYDYAAGSGRTFFDQLIKWRPYDGFLLSLFLSSHSSMTVEINIDQLGSEDLVAAFDFLHKHGDRTSQLGAIEVGLRVLSSRPEIEQALIGLIEQIRDDDVAGKTRGFKLLSALFFLVDGELSRTRLLSTEPPFYRRLAALSQAALIHRQFVNSTVDIDQFCEWAFSNRGEQCYFQSLADMRLEPRWNPDLADASQLKADFFGRIMIAAKNYEKNIRGCELSGLILGVEPGSLHSFSEFPRPYFPGPLEGAGDAPSSLPSEMSEVIASQLSAEEVGPSSFIALVNSALIFRVGSDQAELAAKVLKLGSYRLTNVEDRGQLLAILNGLAMVAAVARSWPLADELRILVRRYRHDAQYALSIDEDIRICLVSAASRAKLEDWREFVGAWLTELAFSDLVGNDGAGLYSRIRCLCHVVPELWVSCGRADAALRAYNACRHPA